MTATDDPDEYESKWHDHLDELNRIFLAANDEEMQEISRHRDELKRIVTTIAARERRRAEEND